MSSTYSGHGKSWLAFGSTAAGVTATGHADTQARIACDADGVLTLSYNASDAVRLAGLAAPTGSSDAATKAYVDTVMANTFVYPAVDYSTGAALANNSGTGTITFAYSTNPSTITFASSSSFSTLFNTGSAMSSETFTAPPLGMTILIRHVPAGVEWGTGSNKMMGIWVVSSSTSATVFTLTRHTSMATSDQVRSGGYVFVKKGASADQAFVISNDFERALVTSSTAITASGAHSVGATTLTLSSATGTGTTSVNYSSATFDVASLILRAGQCIIVNNNYHRVVTNVSGSTSVTITPGLYSALSGGESIKIGLNLLSTSATDVTTEILAANDSTYTIAWTQFSGSGTTYTGTANQITLTGSTFSLATSMSKTDYTAFTATCASGNMLLSTSGGTLKLNSTTGALSISDDGSATAVNIGTGAAAKTVIVGSTTSSSSLVLQSGTGVLTLAGALCDSGNFTAAVKDNVSAAFTIKESSNAYMTIDTTNTAERVLFSKDVYGADGISFYTQGAGVFLATSDVALKKNIHTVANPLDMLEKMRGVTWDWRNSDKTSCGVVAQELQEVMPYAVQCGSDNLLRVNYQVLTGVFIEAIKELKTKMDVLTAEREADQCGKSSAPTAGENAMAVRRYNMRRRV